ncbi:DUF3667 domain-containing protein [Tenacibaculum sp. 190524A02b]|uniref:DUF3667 domain-containing protein n=1 Tax=Tenacibaculum vairaonense TaxID=3137860 RepID=A0ABP1FCG5_9FLAO
MAKNNKVAIIKDPNCLNCNYPFTKGEKFCPECGQKNKGKRITLLSFIREMFAGFFSWDAKFWRTLIPLLINPGKVSRNYIEGRRSRYSNPFRFYLTTSIIFFLLLGASKTYDRFQELTHGKKEDTETIASNKNSPGIAIDSIKNIVNKEIKNQNIQIDSTTQKEISNVINGIQKKERPNEISFFGEKSTFKLDRFIRFNRDNPDLDIDQALDSLQMKKTFFNRFIYNRAVFARKIVKDENTLTKFLDQLLSYGSVALFIFLPIFTFFLKILYLRRNYTYVEHLIFVFHTQTVFFLLLSGYTILDFFSENSHIWIFACLFVLYLFMAMKKFYQQGFFKTFIKFTIINHVFIFLASIGAICVALVAFAFS